MPAWTHVLSTIWRGGWQRRDLEDNFKAVLQSGLARLDLVSRQEFDVQAAVLRRTREKLEALEARLATLENGEKTPVAKP